MHNRLVSSAVLVLALAAIAVPTASARAGATADIAATATPCVFHVTYAWSGFSGTNVYIRVLYDSNGVALVAAADNLPVSGRSGSVSTDLTVPSGEGFHQYHSRGTMTNKRDQDVKGSTATSTTSVTTTC
jgi:hypothetical protein